MKKIYNRVVEIPLILEFLSRLRTELTGELDTRMISVNRMLYSIAEALKYYDPTPENADKIVEHAYRSYLYKQRKVDAKTEKYAKYIISALKILNTVNSSYRQIKKKS